MEQARAQSPEPQHSEPQMPRPYPGVGVREYGRIVGARGRFGLFVHNSRGADPPSSQSKKTELTLSPLTQVGSFGPV